MQNVTSLGEYKGSERVLNRIRRQDTDRLRPAAGSRLIGIQHTIQGKGELRMWLKVEKAL